MCRRFEPYCSLSLHLAPVPPDHLHVPVNMCAHSLFVRVFLVVMWGVECCVEALETLVHDELGTAALLTGNNCEKWTWRAGATNVLKDFLSVEFCGSLGSGGVEPSSSSWESNNRVKSRCRRRGWNRLIACSLLFVAFRLVRGTKCLKSDFDVRATTS